MAKTETIPLDQRTKVSISQLSNRRQQKIVFTSELSLKQNYIILSFLIFLLVNICENAMQSTYFLSHIPIQLQSI